MLNVGMFSFRFLAHSVTTLCRSAAAGGRVRIKLGKTERSRDVKGRPHGDPFSMSAP